MGLLALLRQVNTLLPDGMQGLRSLYAIAIILISSLYVETTADAYKIISNRMEFSIAIVTPHEIDVMGDLCITGDNPFTDLLYDKDSICTEQVKEFFYDRLDQENPTGHPKG